MTDRLLFAAVLPLYVASVSGWAGYLVLHALCGSFVSANVNHSAGRSHDPR